MNLPRTCLHLFTFCKFNLKTNVNLTWAKVTVWRETFSKHNGVNFGQIITSGVAESRFHDELVLVFKDKTKYTYEYLFKMQIKSKTCSVLGKCQQQWRLFYTAWRNSFWLMFIVRDLMFNLAEFNSIKSK